jgi:regulation of enolase protein 1 (concanavalin A-like superfamily)
MIRAHSLLVAALVLNAVAPAAPAAAEQLTTIVNNGPATNRIDIVILGDGYTAQEMSRFVRDVEITVPGLFAEEPFREYASYFNVHRIDVVSAESGADHPSAGIYRQTALGSAFECGAPQLLCVDMTALNDVLARSTVPAQRDLVIVIINDPSAAGTGGGVALLTNGYGELAHIALHELGHSFGFLADEYIATPLPGYSCVPSTEPFAPNVTVQTDRARIKWRHWIDPSTAVPTPTSADWGPGLYEGAQYCIEDFYRPTLDSKMRNSHRAFGPVNTEQLVKRMYNFVSPIETASPQWRTRISPGTELLDFSVGTTLRPATHALQARWELNGAPVAAGTSVRLDTRTLAEGPYYLTAILEDPTPFVRSDPDGALREIHEWTIHVDRTMPWIRIEQPIDGATVAGSIAVSAIADEYTPQLQLIVDGRIAGDPVLPDRVVWDTRAWPNGAHTLQLRAWDNAGNTSVSPAIGVVVANSQPSALPAGWTSQDIGAVGVAGSATHSGGTFTVKGAGADVWGTSDAFHFAYRTLNGDGTIVARVASVQGDQPWTKMGVMIRASADPSAAYAFMLVSTAKGLAFQRRVSDGAFAAHTSGGAASAPRWVRLDRAGSTITAAVSADGVAWTTVGRDTFTMPATVLVGLAANGNTTTSLATGTFDNVTVGAPALPGGWTSQDIGAVGVPGSATHSAGAFTVKGAGADVWGTSDAFHFAFRTLNGDGTIVARIASIQGTQAWTKMGVMIRASTDPSAAYAFMLVSTAKGLAFQRRTSHGALATHTSGGAGTAPRWVRLDRAGNTITAAVSADGAAWTTVGSDTFTMPATVLVGLAANGNTTTALATGTFDNVTVAAPALPAGWASQDIGAVGVAGSATHSGGTFTVKGAGADVWGTSDAFHFAYRTLNGDGTIVARVASVQGDQAWTKMGVMIRASADPSAAYAFMLVSTAKGLAFQRRVSGGAFATHTGGGAGSAPRWVRLDRAGNTITAAVSADGATWTVVGSDTFTMPTTVLVGLAAHGNNTTTLATGTFDGVAVGSR